MRDLIWLDGEATCPLSCSEI